MLGYLLAQHSSLEATGRWPVRECSAVRGQSASGAARAVLRAATGGMGKDDHVQQVEGDKRGGRKHGWHPGA